MPAWPVVLSKQQKARFNHAWVIPNPSGLNAHYQPAALA
jgi:hypothetical protein